MRFLVDECTGPAVAAWLRSAHHDVFSVYEEARGLDDVAIIQKAYNEIEFSLPMIKILAKRFTANVTLIME